ncbi:DUF3301 domain-containing protein [Stutzerimonas tarimensis]|uniref:DUF3301 domain-containing protein n=1 Tax=Stutzerimonas tarimensis TaxID=1507735 RepID=A0ABV7T745_9GAMM
MITFGNLTLFLLLATLGAWLWHAYGIRERALAAVRRHCDKEAVELLDGNVAFRRLGLVNDARGQRRLARVYGFEFTVTGEQRHPGTIVMFGPRVGYIELAPHPYQPCAAEPAPAERAQVVVLADWRRERSPRRD